MDVVDDLERDVPAERFLDRLVHDAHAAAAQLAEDAEFAEPLGQVAACAASPRSRCALRFSCSISATVGSSLRIFSACSG